MSNMAKLTEEGYYKVLYLDHLTEKDLDSLSLWDLQCLWDFNYNQICRHLHCKNIYIFGKNEVVVKCIYCGYGLSPEDMKACYESMNKLDNLSSILRLVKLISNSEDVVCRLILSKDEFNFELSDLKLKNEDI